MLCHPFFENRRQTDAVDIAETLLGITPVDPQFATEVKAFGIYAWWGKVPWPDGFPEVRREAPIYIGIAATETLADRFSNHHLTRTRGSALRRSLAALLAHELDLHSHLVLGSAERRSKFGLTAHGEHLLTEWMERELRVTWVETPSPGATETRLIRELLPPLNDRDATGSPYRAPMRALRAVFASSSHR